MARPHLAEWYQKSRSQRAIITLASPCHNSRRNSPHPEVCINVHVQMLPSLSEADIYKALKKFKGKPTVEKGSDMFPI